MKHITLDRSKTPPLVKTAGQVELKAIGLDQAVWGEFGYDMHPQAVVILDDGAHGVIAKVVAKALASLEAETDQRGSGAHMRPRAPQ